MIKINNLNKYYLKGKTNEIHVINDCNLELPSTGLITLLGESGAGKTTLLNVIGGLDKATGDITYDDNKFRNYQMGKIDKYRRENIGYIFQNYNILPNLTVIENLSLALELIGITDKDEVDKRIKAALTAVGLYKYRKKPASKLSGGQQQRVAIARALIKKCKILIADEPTGNLDSTNSIEVMSILKKISDQSLVILVTHDKTLAEFYSTKIIELVDGKIVNIRDANSNVSLQNKDENKIYLNDLNKIEDGTKINSVVFSDTDIPNINITLVHKNGTYYIKSNVKIRPIEDTNLELINDSYKETTVDEYKNSLNYSTDIFDDSKRSRNLKRNWLLFKSELHNYFKARKRVKFLRFVLILLGVAMGFMATTFCSIMYHDYSSALGDKNVYKVVGNDLYYDIRNATKEAYDLNYIDSFDGIYESEHEIEFIYNKNSYSKKSYSANLTLVDYSAAKNNKIIYGNEPKSDDEFVLGKKLADRLVKKFKLGSYEKLFKVMEYDVGYSDYTKCVGVTSKNTISIYANKYNYKISKGGYGLNQSFIHFDDDMLKDYRIDNTLKGSYLDDTDVNENTIFIYAHNRNFYGTDNYISICRNSEYINNNKIMINGMEITIKGEVQISGDGERLYNDDERIYYVSTKNKEIFKLFNTPNKNNWGGDYVDGSIMSMSSHEGLINIIEGKEKPGLGECLAYYGNNEIGEYVTVNNYKYRVVGLYSKPFEYTGGMGHYKCYLLDDIEYSFYKSFNFYDNSVSIIANNKKIIDVFEKNDVKIINLRSDKIHQIDKENNKANLKAWATVGVIFAIVLVYIYFTMRSKMIFDIYEIGVLRNLGASRSRIFIKYIFEIAITTVFTTLLGYLAFIFMYGYIWDNITSLSSLFPQYKILSAPYPYLGIILIFALNMIVGLIPTIFLLRKTPKEISSKYDI